MKIALIYDWFAERGGGERAFEAIYNLYPSPIYTLFFHPNSLKQTSFQSQHLHSSFIQKLPWATKKFRNYFPLFPLAIEQFDLSSYDLILSTSHCVAKGVLTHADQIHLCYCLTPVRYAWDLYYQYLSEANLHRGWKGRIAKFFLHYIRLWDVQSSHRVDSYAAISHYVARRIEKIYRRKATVIYPPVDTDYFAFHNEKEEYYLAASRFVPYKKMNLIISAFNQMPTKKLIVIGDGPEWEKARKNALNNIQLLGYQPNNVLLSYLQKAKAFVFAALEDFGILPVEAQSCGTPVIAYGKGASLETVKEGITGVFFDEQTPKAICEAVKKFELIEDQFDPKVIRSWAETFNPQRFAEQYSNWVKTECQKIHSGERECTSLF